MHLFVDFGSRRSSYSSCGSPWKERHCYNAIPLMRKRSLTVESMFNYDDADDRVVKTPPLVRMRPSQIKAVKKKFSKMALLTSLTSGSGFRSRGTYNEEECSDRCWPEFRSNSAATMTRNHADRSKKQVTGSLELDAAGDCERQDSCLGKAPCPGLNLLTINVSGLRFQTYMETLDRFPETLLGCELKRRTFYNEKTDEYFFDRHRASFEAILYYYQSYGKLRRPESIPIDVFLKELRFFELGDRAMEKFWLSEGYRKPEELPLPDNRIQRMTWQLMEHPDSSFFARIVAFISVSVIILSTVCFCVETIPSIREKYQPSPRNSTYPEVPFFYWSDPFHVIEVFCITWFTLEFALRFLSCPSKLTFCKSFLNWVDIVAIVPFFINIALDKGKDERPEEKGSSGAMSLAVLRVLRLVRVFRIFKLSRHSSGLQILGKTFQASVEELGLLIFFVMIGLVLFSSAVYFAEHGNEDSKFTSIPEAFWYTIVTMTTVGYGDLTPVNPIGKLVGSLCAISGVLVLALPVPVIVANFKHFYRQETRLVHMKEHKGNEERDFSDAASESS